jgi:molecular chaperone HtpG
VSPLESGESFAGFYNRGLTLFETSDEVFQGLAELRFKVMSASLKHTLSRDNVRRDDAFERAVDRVRDLANKPLRQELRKQLREAAEEAARGHSMKRYVSLLEAASLAPLALPPDEVVLPLAHETEGSRTILLSVYRRHKPPLATETPSALTRALARIGEPVLLLSSPFVDSFLAGCLTPLPVAMAHQVYLLIDELGDDTLRPNDRTLCHAVRTALDEAGVGLTRIGIGKVVDGSGGAADGDSRIVALSVPEGRSREPKLCKISDAYWARRTGSTLLLDADHAVVEAARQRAQSDPKIAGHLLARILLVEHGDMGAKQSDGLLSLAARDFT